MIQPLLLALTVLLSAQAAIAHPQAAEELTPDQQTQVDKAEELNVQVIKLYRQRNYAQATELAQQVLQIFENVFGPDHPEIVFGLKNLAMPYMTQANYAAAEPLYKRALKITEKNVGPDHPDTATCLNDLALAYKGQGNYAAAEPLYLRALRIREKALGPEHPDTSLSLNNLAVLYKIQNNNAAAEPLYKRALQINENVLGPDHPETANCLNNLAKLYQGQGNYAAAEPLYRRALKIREKSLGEDDPTTALSVNTLASLYAIQGNYAGAEPLYQRALKIREKTLGPDHPSTAITISNLAWLHDEQHDYRAAEPLYRRALQIAEKALGPDHPDTGISLNNLAEVYRMQGDYAAAEPLYERALKIKEKSLGPEHPSTALSLNNLALLCDGQGNDAAAEPLYQRALKINERSLGLEHPDTALMLNNLAVFYSEAGKADLATELFDKARRGIREHVTGVLPALSAAEQALFLSANYESDFYSILSHAVQNSEQSDLVSKSAAWLINGKAVAQEALAQRNLLTRDIKDPKLAPLVEQLLQVREQLAGFAMTLGEPEKVNTRQTKISELTTTEQELTRQLSSSHIGSERSKTSWIEFEQVQSALLTSSVLIDIAHFKVVNFRAKAGENKWQPARYAAWITLGGEMNQPVLVDLGLAEEIDVLVSQVRRQIETAHVKDGAIQTNGEVAATNALKNELAALADRIWKPLQPYLGNAKEVILSPDGALWLAPWAALPETDDRYLIEEYDIRFVISGRDLVTKPGKYVTQQSVILADPQFDQPASEKESSIKAIFKELPPADDATTRSFSAKSLLPKVSQLPNTGIEAIAIQPSLEKYSGQPVTLYKERYALERVAKALQRPKVAAFATHGFFLPKQETNSEDRNRLTSNEPRSVALDASGKLIENPLLRCGLLLAGCNNRDAVVGDDDGILTGLEIVSIDFRGTELVVLSACETGIGDVRNGEGVAGLRQAFQLAGAEAVVSTLWQVPDRDSALLTSKFFEELAAGKSKAEALRIAQLERIERRRERYGAAHPFFWAAFTLTGQ